MAASSVSPSHSRIRRPTSVSVRRIARSARTTRPRHRDIDWDRTIRANLRSYLPEYRTVVPERLVGHGRAAQGVRKEAEAAFHAQADRWLNSLDVVRREEFDAVREMAIQARDENDALRARIEALEAKLSAAKD